MFRLPLELTCTCVGASEMQRSATACREVTQWAWHSLWCSFRGTRERRQCCSRYIRRNVRMSLFHHIVWLRWILVSLLCGRSSSELSSPFIPTFPSHFHTHSLPWDAQVREACSYKFGFIAQMPSSKWLYMQNDFITQLMFLLFNFNSIRFLWCCYLILFLWASQDENASKSTDDFFLFYSMIYISVAMFWCDALV